MAADSTTAAIFLPGGLSLADELDFLDDEDRRLLSQVQGRTYARMFSLLERFITAKMMGLGHAQCPGQPRSRWRRWCAMTDDELRHQRCSAGSTP